MQSVVHDILQAWRRAEHAADLLPEGSREREAAIEAAAQLRALYHEALDASSAGERDPTTLRGLLNALSRQEPSTS